jgi:phosphohistidine swiveling domain-containing protein
MTTTPAAGAPISLPEDFPVTWEHLEDEARFWFWDQMHHPKAITPVAHAFSGRAFSEGIGRANAALYMPLKTSLVRRINCYLYMGAVPATTDPDEVAAREKKMMSIMVQRAPRALSDWENLYLPQVEVLNQRLHEYPYAEASTRGLASFLDEVLDIRAKAWEIHFLALYPVMGATLQFAQLYEDTFGAPASNEHYRMLQGFPNKSVEAGQALYDLAQEAKEDPDIVEAIQTAPTEAIFGALERTAKGKEFAAKLRAYIDEYGWRADNFDVVNVSWREEPSPVIHNLRACLRDGATDPRVEQAKAAAERERLVSEMLERAPDPARRNQLQMLVAAAQAYLPVQENHNFYIDQMNTVSLRLPLLEMGRRLTNAGVIETLDDIFYLTLDEMQAAAVDSHAKWRPLVRERRDERDRWAKVVPPLFIGTEPPPGTPRQPTLERFFGFGHEPSRDPKVITGRGASTGVVTGTAKVVCTLAESDKLEQGDILVCEMTMPSWTPLFSIASAVVADSGGVLSHCAIVAREYRIPCVVGTQNGTQRLRDGQLLTVDGAKGIVRIE